MNIPFGSSKLHGIVIGRRPGFELIVDFDVKLCGGFEGYLLKKGENQDKQIAIHYRKPLQVSYQNCRQNTIKLDEFYNRCAIRVAAIRVTDPC